LAHLSHEAPSLWDRQQHRVEGEQEADHRADRGKQRGGLRGRGLGRFQHRQFAIGGLHVQASGGDALHLCFYQPLLAGLGLDEDLVDAPWFPGEFLCESQQSHDDRAVGHGANGLAPQDRADFDPMGVPGREQGDVFVGLGADMFGDLGGEPESAGHDPRFLVALPSSTTSAPVTPISCTDSLPLGPTITAFSRNRGAATLTPLRSATRLAIRCSKPSGERAASWRCALPVTPCTSWLAEPRRLELATRTPKSSATPIAMPRPASSSWALWLLRRQRERSSRALTRSPRIA